MKDYRKYAEDAFESSDIEIKCNGTRKNRKAMFVMRAKGSLAADPKTSLEGFRTNLAKRLPEYSRVLEIDFLRSDDNLASIRAKSKT